MKVREILNRYQTKWRIERKDSQWNHSDRKREIEAECDLPPRPLTIDEEQLLRWMLQHFHFYSLQKPEY